MHLDQQNEKLIKKTVRKEKKRTDLIYTFFSLEYAGELHIIALRKGKDQNSQVTHTTTHPRHTPPPQPLGGSLFDTYDR